MTRDQFAEILKKKILISVSDSETGTNKFYREIVLPDHREKVKRKKKYLKKGCDILISDPLKFPKRGLTGSEFIFEKIHRDEISATRRAGNEDTLILGSLSLPEEFMQPLGSMSFDRVFEIFRRQTEFFLDCKVNGIAAEGFGDIKILKTAAQAVRSVSESVILKVQMTIGEKMKSVSGTPVSAFGILFDDLDVDVLGLSFFSPCDICLAISELTKFTDKFISVKPLNSGSGIHVEDIIKAGAGIIDFDCGVCPDVIENTIKYVSDLKPAKRKKSSGQYLTSRTYIMGIDPFLIIGERINPSSRPALQKQILNKNFSGLIAEAEGQKSEGASALDINLGNENILDYSHFKELFFRLDKISSLPLVPDIQNRKYLADTIKEYPGRTLINSAKVTSSDLSCAIRIMKENGGAAVLLAMDDKIPETSEKRVNLILDGIREFESKGISRDRIFADPLVLPLKTNYDSAVTEQTVAKLTRCGIKTVCGLSNISFGMTGRSFINGDFLTKLVNCGLTAAIMNPGDKFVMNCLNKALKQKNKKEEA
ncbi:MAG: hypothetical protein CSB55_01790 [Candidatus Cloacimonadota bacterium]|nr:MAG: hypothetical protein CSB55_01790 [Candidatus Cloacimonadota bacterium]